MTFLIFAEAYRGGRRGPAVPVLVGVLVLCLVGNAVRLVTNADGLADRAEEVGSQIAMIELAGEAANPGFRPVFAEPVGSTDIVAAAGPLNEFADEHGSLGMSVDEVKALTPRLRADADFILARALDLVAVPAPEDAGEVGECRTEEGGSRVPLPPGAYVLRAPDDDGAGPLRLGRFGDRAETQVGEVGPDPVVFGIAEDERAGDDPWFTEAEGALEICATGGAAG